MPKVSVITPCYNRSQFIGETIESVISQSFQDWEYIIVDDGSTDESWKIINEYAVKDSRIKALRQSNGGACKARNHGFKYCSSDSHYVIWLDSDDLMGSDMLVTMVEYLDTHPQVGLAFCDYQFIDTEDRYLSASEIIRFDEANNIWGVREIPHSDPQTTFTAIGVYCILEPTALLRKSVYVQTSGWPEWLGQVGEGMWLFTQVALLSEVHFVPKVLFSYRQHDQQSMRNPQHEKRWSKLCERWLENPKQKHYLEYKRLVWFFDYRYVPYRWLVRGELPRKLYIFKALARYCKSFLNQPPKFPSYIIENTYREYFLTNKKKIE